MTPSASTSPSRSRVRPRGRTELQCHFCGRAFFKTDHLRRHERSHTKERPFHCGECNKYFSRHDTLLRHLKKLHYAADAPDQPDAQDSLGMIALESRETFRGVDGIDLSPPIVEDSLRRGMVIQLADDAMLGEVAAVEWTPSTTFPDQSWWFDYDFDPNSLDMSLFEPMAFPDLFTPHISSQDISQLPPDERILPGSEIQKAWFTYMEHRRSPCRPQAGPSNLTNNNESYELDEEFRMRACQTLRNRSNIEPLPSTGLLNLSIKMYFEEFASLFPIIHRHTFRPSPENSPLLLLMSALGCLLEGDVARGHGVKIFERFSSTAMASWDATLRSDSQEAISLVQAAVLGQLFGLLSGEAKHLSMVDNFHGTVIAWARKCDMFRQVNQYPNLESLGDLALQRAWNSWAKSEEVLRAALGLYIVDAQIAGIFHHDPLLRHDLIGSNLAADEVVFDAPNAAEWKVRILLKTSTSDAQLPLPLQNNSQLNSYVVLQNISASICEGQARGKLVVASEEYERLLNDLLNWHAIFEAQLRDNPSRTDAFDLMTLWHASFLNLLADFNKLERALGRDGLHNVFLESDIAYAVNWSKSPAADRCVLHALEIQETLSQMRLSTESAIHIPHCTFLAGITTYSCLRFRRPAMLARYPPPLHPSSRSLTDFPEFNIHGELERNQQFRNTPVLFENDRGELFMHTLNPQRPVLMVGVEVFRQCCEGLQRMGHFEIARSYAKTLKALIHVEIEKWMHG